MSSNLSFFVLRLILRIKNKERALIFIDIEKIILNFIWDDKPAKIKKTILFKEKTEGGLNLTNIKIYAKSYHTSKSCQNFDLITNL
jgi:hypothetical protein